ncbi:hypothetical protein BDU57DRAFT_517081 [Ampelomyces quisqualis]|uniref:Uncharacterized protein n=1 Tax=Ampelomyces quisqualis TaxID=50730 RepID=A0A6A5QN27_AMPQU|nr:hypothetical protein BDU57DRAFT_517081 [Ampelomyces quisqualis]
MNFLDLSRMADTPRQVNQTAEDDFCTRLHAVGAEWWELPPSFEDRKHLGSEQFRCDTLEACFEPKIQFPYLIAWSEVEQVACYIAITQADSRDQAGLNLYHNAMDMDERCAAIMSPGGHWCRCKAGCPDLKDLAWRTRDRGPDGCHDPPLYIVDPEDPADPEQEL